VLGRRRDRRAWIFRTGEEAERWTVAVRLAEPGAADRAAVEQRVRAALLYVSTLALESRTEAGAGEDETVVRYRILVPHVGAESWGGILRRMISETSVPPLLG
jgi:hypothetical protein